MPYIPRYTDEDFCPECGWFIGDADGAASHGVC